MSTERVLFDVPGPRARLRHRMIAAVGALALVALLGWITWRMHTRNQLTAAKWEPFLDGRAWTQYLLPGVFDTLRAAGIAIVLSLVLALLLALARMSDIAPLRWVASVFVEFFRAVPVLIMMLFTFVFLAQRDWTPDAINPLIAVVTGLTLYNSSVLCEVIRSGVASLPAGQREAGLSIGLSTAQVRRAILVPQALTAMLPTIVSQLIVITKDSALGYVITYSELLTRTRQLGSSFANTLPAYLVAALIFILINYALSKLAEWVEHRQRRRKRTAGSVAHVDAANEEMGQAVPAAETHAEAEPAGPPGENLR